METFITNQRLAHMAGVSFDSESIMREKIIYSRTHTIKKQFNKLSKFPNCVLITSFSDASCTDELADKLPSNVIKWFSNNVETNNPRIEGIPIGMIYSHDIENDLREAIKNGRKSDTNLMYINFTKKICRRVNPRLDLYEMFQDEEWVTAIGGDYYISTKKFYDQVNSHPYVLSPPGAGPDCHRHWESLVLGSIPIVIQSPFTKLLNGLPVLQVDSWEEVTQERLEEELPELKKLFNTPRMKICYFEYWKEKILGEVNEK